MVVAADSRLVVVADSWVPVVLDTQCSDKPCSEEVYTGNSSVDFGSEIGYTSDKYLLVELAVGKLFDVLQIQNDA